MLIHNDIKPKALHTDKHYIAIEVEQMAIVNMYLPGNDKNKSVGENSLILANVLGDITDLVQRYSETIIARGMNYHRDNKCRRSLQIEEFLEALSMDKQSDLRFYDEKDYTFESNINGSKTLIDRIICSDSISDYTYRDSDHMLWKLTVSHNNFTSRPDKKEYRKGLNWDIASNLSIRAYKEKETRCCREVQKEY